MRVLEIAWGSWRLHLNVEFHPQRPMRVLEAAWRSWRLHLNVGFHPQRSMRVLEVAWGNSHQKTSPMRKSNRWNSSVPMGQSMVLRYLMQLTSKWASGTEFLISVTTDLFLMVILPLAILYFAFSMIIGLLVLLLYALLPAAFYGVIYAITSSDGFSENWRTTIRQSAIFGAFSMFLNLIGCVGLGLYKWFHPSRQVVHRRSPHISRKGCACHFSHIFCT